MSDPTPSALALAAEIIGEWLKQCDENLGAAPKITFVESGCLQTLIATRTAELQRERDDYMIVCGQHAEARRIAEAQVATLRAETIEEYAREAEKKLLVFDGNADLRLGVKMARGLIAAAIRALAAIPAPDAEMGEDCMGRPRTTEAQKIIATEQKRIGRSLSGPEAAELLQHKADAKLWRMVRE